MCMRDIPCLEDIGVNELEDGDSLTGEQRLANFGRVCRTHRNKV